MAIVFLKSALAFYDKDSGVKSLQESNFNKYIKRNKYVLVEFYAPWCGHCQNLKPEYIKAAKELKDIVPLAAVDANEDTNKGLAAKYEIKGFPTLKLFIDGKPQDFNQREAEPIIENLKKDIPNKYITILTPDNKDEFFALKKQKILFFGEEEEADAISRSLSMRFYKHFSFGYIGKNEKGLVENFGIKNFPQILLIEDDGSDPKKTKPFGDYNASKIKDRITTMLGAKLDEFEKFDILHDQSCLEKHCIQGGNLCVFFVEAGDKSLVESRRRILYEAREELLDESFFKFVTIDAEEHKDYLFSLFGKKTKLTFPRIFIVSHKKKLFSAFKQEFTSSNIVDFLSGFPIGKPIEKVMRFKSPEVPKMSEKSKNCDFAKETIKSKKESTEKKESFVVAATDKTFDSLLKQSKLPVFVEFYAPWCGHCKEFAPKYEKAAAKLASTVLFVKVDATSEKKLAEKYNITGYPTIKFSKGFSSKEAGEDSVELLDYTSGRTIDSILKNGKTLLSEQSKVIAKKSDELAKSPSETFGGQGRTIIFFLTAMRKHSHMIDALSLYFSDKEKTDFVKLKGNLETAKEFFGIGDERIVVVKTGEKDVHKQYAYKGKFEFSNLSRDLGSLFDGKTTDIDNYFAYKELTIATEEKIEEKTEL